MAIQLILFIIIAILLLIILYLLYVVMNASRSKHPPDQAMIVEWLKSMQATVNSTNTSIQEVLRGSTSDINKTLQLNTKAMNERLDRAGTTIAELHRSVGELTELGKGVRALQDLLQSPKLRGNLGEQGLGALIGASFPKNAFHLQYQFRSGVRVDAVLKTDGGLLCIDAKFPMEQFNLMYKAPIESERNKARKAFIDDVKKHMKDIKSKYIIPENETMDFALMYIPSEPVYYEVVMMEELMGYARSLRVFPVSPNTLYAHLQVLLVGLSGRQIEEKTKEVAVLLRSIVTEYSKLEEHIAVLGKHVTNSYNSMQSVNTTVVSLGQKVMKTKMLESA